MTTRREFLWGLGAVAAAVPLARTGKAAPRRARRAVSTPDEGVVAKLADGILHIEWRLSARSGDRRRVPPAEATFIVAIAQVSQKPLGCRLLADLAGCKVEGPLVRRGGTGHRATVPVASLGSWIKGTRMFLHASFWQHHSAVIAYTVGA